MPKPKALYLCILFSILVVSAGCVPPVDLAPGTPAPTKEGITTASPTSGQTLATLTTPEDTSSQEPVPLKIFCAGSLILPFDDLEVAFEKRYPNIDVQNECHGSIQVIRHVTELHQAIDVVATADHALIPMLMYSTTDPDSGKPYANWYIQFASNRLALAYSDRSKYSDQIQAGNWYEFLTRPGVKLGIADPRFDASGYRALMLIKLAEELYGRPTLFASLFTGQFSMPITLTPQGDLTIIRVPEIIQPKKDSRIVIRGASIQLIALLESGDLDYAFEYESVIQQHRLRMIQFPDQLNLGAEGFDEFYGKVQVQLDFQRFATVKPEFKGERIGYGIAIPSNAPHPEAAIQYITFLLSSEGRQIMGDNFHPIFTPPIGQQFENIPPILQSLCVSGN